MGKPINWRAYGTSKRIGEVEKEGNIKYPVAFEQCYRYHTQCNKKYNLQVVRMFIAVVSIFGICWLPYHMFYVYAYHNPMMTSSAYVPHLFLGFYFLAMSNTMVNPIIYYWMNRKFRHYFQEVMCFCCFQLWKVNSINKAQDIYLHQNSLSMDRKSKSCKQKHSI